MSLDIALTSPIGEDQERGYMQTILLRMTNMEGAQRWFGAESVGMGVLTSVSFTVAH